MVKIDTKDKKILFQLTLNSRQSYNQIAKKVGLTKDVVAYRIKKLQENGVIINFFANVNPYALGFATIRFFYNYRFINPTKKKEIIDYMISSKNTWAVSSTEGNYNLQVNMFIEIQKPEKFINFYDDIQMRFREYFDNQFGTLLTRGNIYNLSFYFDTNPNLNKITLKSEFKQVKIDNDDIKILQILSQNSRISTIEISKQLSLSSKTIKNRIQKLVKANYIKEFTVFIDWSKIQLRPFFLEINLKNYKQKYDIIKYIKQNKYLNAVEESIGNNIDLNFWFILKNVKQLQDIIDDLSEKYPDSIQNFKYCSYIKWHKWNYMPPIDL